MATSIGSQDAMNIGACISANNRTILEMVLKMDEFKLETPRNALVLKNVNLLLQASGPLLVSVERITLAMKQQLKQLVMYDKMLGKKVHSFRGYDLPNILEKEGHGLPDSMRDDMILWQCVADMFIQAIVDEEISIASHSKSKERIRLTLVEENAVRYAGGYVIRKVQKNKGSCLDCLNSLLLDAGSDSTDLETLSFFEYTQIWLKKTDKGGLYHISDACYELFYEIEQNIYSKLQNNLASKKKNALHEIEQAAFCDSDVQRMWKNCSLDVDEGKGNEILHSIIHEWTMLRGHSLTRKYMDEYKRAKHEGMKKKSTRKELKLRNETAGK